MEGKKKEDCLYYYYYSRNVITGTEGCLVASLLPVVPCEPRECQVPRPLLQVRNRGRAWMEKQHWEGMVTVVVERRTDTGRVDSDVGGAVAGPQKATSGNKDQTTGTGIVHYFVGQHADA
jgi:hypothetical protein